MPRFWIEWTEPVRHQTLVEAENEIKAEAVFFDLDWIETHEVSYGSVDAIDDIYIDTESEEPSVSL